MMIIITPHQAAAAVEEAVGAAVAVEGAEDQKKIITTVAAEEEGEKTVMRDTVEIMKRMRPQCHHPTIIITNVEDTQAVHHHLILTSIAAVVDTIMAEAVAVVDTITMTMKNIAADTITKTVGEDIMQMMHLIMTLNHTMLKIIEKLDLLPLLIQNHRQVNAQIWQIISLKLRQQRLTM